MHIENQEFGGTINGDLVILIHDKATEKVRKSIPELAEESKRLEAADEEEKFQFSIRNSKILS